MSFKIKKAVIPVAGLGTRMLPATKAIPKELLTIYDRPIIEHVVQEAVDGGISEIILVTRSGKEAIENHFDSSYELEHRLRKKDDKGTLGKIRNVISDGVTVTSVRQKEPLGLGHAVLCAKHLLNNEPFAVMLPDVLVLDQDHRKDSYSFKKLIRAWEDTGIGQIMVEPVASNKIENYGIVDIDHGPANFFESQKLKGLVEKPTIKEAPSNLAIVGRYILPFKVLELLENLETSHDQELQLTDALNKLVKIQEIHALTTDADVFDCGSKLGFLAANVAVGIKDPVIKGYLKKLLE